MIARIVSVVCCCIKILKNITKTFVFCLLALFAPLLASHALAAGLASILSTEIEQHSGNELIVFSCSGPINHQKIFLLQNPTRVVLDIDSARGDGVRMPAGYSHGLVSNLRFGQFDGDTSRIVIDVSGSVEQASIHKFNPIAGKPYRLVVDVTGKPGDITAEAPKPNKQAQAPAAKPAPSKFDQGKPLVILDPGHGGKDPGASGSSGTQEKNINFAFARSVREAILHTGRYRVALTRDTDELIALKDRVAIARKAGGDVFISLHSDSASSAAARGLSVYTVSEEASDAESAALAEQENDADIIAGVPLMHADKEVADILIDLAQQDTKRKSSRLADLMVGEFRQQGIAMLPSPHRFAGFRVLKAPDIPSVLIEVGFLSNPADEKTVQTEQHHKRVAQGIIYTLDKYFAKK